MQTEKLTSIHVFDIKMPYQEHKEMHYHDCHEFFITLNGTGEQYTPQGNIKMKKGDVFFFPAGIKHIGNGAASGNCIGGVINVNEKLLLGNTQIYSESEKVLQHLSNNAKQGIYKIPVTDIGRQELFSLFKKMLQEVKIKKIGYRCVASSLMHQFLIEILRNSKYTLKNISSPPSIPFDKINDTVQFLKNHFTEHLNIDRTIQMTNMSKSYFHAKFKQVTGTTYIDFLNSLRIKHAIKMLTDTQENTEKIAFQSGFCSLSHFYKVLKDTTGTTPGKIRKTGLIFLSQMR